MYSLFPNFNKAGKTLTEICSEARENIRKVDKDVQFKNPSNDNKNKRKRNDLEALPDEIENAAIHDEIIVRQQVPNFLYSNQLQEIHYQNDGTQDGFPDETLSNQYSY